MIRVHPIWVVSPVLYREVGREPEFRAFRSAGWQPQSENHRIEVCGGNVLYPMEDFRRAVIPKFIHPSSEAVIGCHIVEALRVLPTDN